MAVLYNILLVLNMVIAIWFIFIVTIQTTKSEGFTGGGSATPMSSRAKPGFEDNMSRITLYSGIAFMGLTAILALIQPYTGR